MAGRLRQSDRAARSRLFLNVATSSTSTQTKNAICATFAAADLEARRWLLAVVGGPPRAA